MGDGLSETEIIPKTVNLILVIVNIFDKESNKRHSLINTFRNDSLLQLIYNKLKQKQGFRHIKNDSLQQIKLRFS